MIVFKENKITIVCDRSTHVVTEVVQGKWQLNISNNQLELMHDNHLLVDKYKLAHVISVDDFLGIYNHDAFISFPKSEDKTWKYYVAPIKNRYKFGAAGLTLVIPRVFPNLVPINKGYILYVFLGYDTEERVIAIKIKTRMRDNGV